MVPSCTDPGPGPITNRVRLFRRRTPANPEWVFAEDVLSAVTFAECERLAELAHEGRVLELGSYYGRSTVPLASTAATVHSVDPHEGGPSDAPRTLVPFLDNLERYGMREKVVVHVGASTDVVRLFREDSFDLVFIDAMHQRPEVDVDVVLAARCLRAGGALALHDYGRGGVWVGDAWHSFGVTEALDEFLGLTHGRAPDLVDTLAVVRSPSGGDELGAWRSGVAAFATALR